MAWPCSRRSRCACVSFSPPGQVVISLGALQRPKEAADKAMAYREAGRIAVACELGICIRPRGISNIRSDEYRGRAHLSLRLGNLDSVILTDEMRLEAEKHAIMSLSSVEPQRKYRPSSVRSHPSKYRLRRRSWMRM
jgi:hypothetical protein